ncbi:hypothetical protein TCON_2488 [Astathelohania contejeani]|uniref:Uncharacterized protein n=1 Tax=Astathelohania contejeani TaxID=164912 RepID=A0ABQ7HVV9_9MICR|nr:hypothetical protein TCON_2488 [Thelohania contejeani]
MSFTTNLNEFLDFSIFTNKTVCIDEQAYTNIDFIICAIVDYFPTIRIVSAYHTSSHYKSIFKKYSIREYNELNSSIYIIDTYKEENHIAFDKYSTFLLDDYSTLKKVYNLGVMTESTSFYIYRSDSIMPSEKLLFDFYIKTYPLSSGLSLDYDGNCEIRKRDQIITRFKYKIKRDSILYEEEKNNFI